MFRNLEKVQKIFRKCSENDQKIIKSSENVQKCSEQVQKMFRTSSENIWKTFINSENVQKLTKCPETISENVQKTARKCSESLEDVLQIVRQIQNMLLITQKFEPTLRTFC
jgi:hypothetical protein